MPLSREDEIRLELMKLEAARRRLEPFIKYVHPFYKESKHQSLIIEHLEKVEEFIKTEGESGIGRLIINIPPRHGKTFMCSETFPAWMIGRNPDKRVILTSYGATLAEKSSYHMRLLMQGNEYKKIYGELRAMERLEDGEKVVEIQRDRQSIQAWDIRGARGGVLAAGVGGPMIGYGAHLMVIDDPHKDRDEAESELMRDNVWDWYTSVALTRLQKGAAIVIIMQRWHEDDLVGRLLDRQGDQWTHINLPAIAEDGDMFRAPGQALWEEEFPKDFLINTIKATQPPRDWNSMYQQKPTSEEGDVFKGDWFVYGEMPRKEDISYGIQVWDCAMTEREEGDFSACATIYVTREGAFVADIFRAHLNFPDLKARMFDLYTQWNNFFPISRIYIENKVAGQSMVQALRRESALPVIPLEPDSKLGKSKLQRANSVSGYVQAGRVVFRKGATWLHDFEHELLTFPRGKHDDMCLCPMTEVLTRSGWKAMVDVKVGEHVWTREGWNKVLECKRTGMVDEWFRLKTSGGCLLEGTGSHPVWVEGKGFVRLDSIKYGDSVTVWSRNKSLMELLSGGIRKVNGSIIEGISKLTGRTKDQSNTCTGIYGENKMEKSQVGWKSTISTETQRTMTSPIWSALLRVNIGRSMQSDNLSILPRFVQKHLNGILLKKEESGTGPMGRILGRIAGGTLRAVQCVERSMQLLFPLVPCTAQESVISVSCEKLEKKRPVWNMKVDMCPEYFANGILTHNCDAFVYGLIAVQGGGRSPQKKITSMKDTWEKYPSSRMSAIMGGLW